MPRGNNDVTSTIFTKDEIIVFRDKLYELALTTGVSEFEAQTLAEIFSKTLSHAEALQVQ